MLIKKLMIESITKILLLFFLLNTLACTFKLPFMKCGADLPLPNYSIRNIPVRDKNGNIKIVKDHTVLIKVSGKCR